MDHDICHWVKIIGLFCVLCGLIYVQIGLYRLLWDLESDLEKRKKDRENFLNKY